MKILKFNICILITFLIFIEDVNSQLCSDCFCGTVGNSSLGEDTLFGGRYKPSRSDIGGAPSGLDFFKVLIVFVQFADEPYSNS